MEFHQIANIFPMLGVEELGELADDIMLNGLRQPIVLYQGQILDGRNRYRAFCDYCGADELPREFFEDIKIYPSGEPAVMDYEGDDPVGYVWSNNMVRRHLTQSQKAASVAERETVGKGWWRKDINVPSPTQKELAENIGVSPTYAKDAAKIKVESPEHFDKLKSGEMTVTQAKRELQSRLPDGYRGKNSHDGNLANGIVATCDVCDQSYDGTNIKYCPYCYYTPDQRSDYLQAERQKRQEQDLLEELPAVKAEPDPGIVVEFAGKRINTLDDLMKVKTPDQKLLDQFFELDLAVIKVRKLVTELSAHPSTKIRSILYGRDEITRTLSYQATSLGESAQFYRELSNGEKSTGSN